MRASLPGQKRPTLYFSAICHSRCKKQFSNISEVHRDVHGPLHGLLQPRLQGLRRAPAERERQHVRRKEGGPWREIQIEHIRRNADYSFSYVICIRMIFGLRSQFSQERGSDFLVCYLINLIKCVPLPWFEACTNCFTFAHKWNLNLQTS